VTVPYFLSTEAQAGKLANIFSKVAYGNHDSGEFIFDSIKF
jgi:hypothetical protein